MSAWTKDKKLDTFGRRGTMMLTKDEYGQVHNSPGTYKALAYALRDHEVTGDPQIFSWVDERMSRFTLLLYLGTNPQQSREELLYVGVEGHGFNGFPVRQYLDPGYVASRLKLALGSAEPLADLLNGVLDNIYPHRGTPKKLMQVFAEADKDLTCICKTDSSMDWVAGDSKCPVHAEWQNPTFSGLKLWVDDEREAPQGWTWVRTSEEAITHLANREVTEMSLDYTLKNKSGGEWDDGAQVLDWLKTHLDRLPAKISAHSSSVAGRAFLEGKISRLTEMSI